MNEELGMAMTDEDRVQAAIHSLPPQGRLTERAMRRNVATRLGAPQGIAAFLAWQLANWALTALIRRLVSRWWHQQSAGAAQPARATDN